MTNEIVQPEAWFLQELSPPCREPSHCVSKHNNNHDFCDIRGNGSESDNAVLACIDSCCNMNKHETTLTLTLEQSETKVVPTDPKTPKLSDTTKGNEIEMMCRKKDVGNISEAKSDVVKNEDGESSANTTAIFGLTSIDTIDTTAAAKSAEAEAGVLTSVSNSFTSTISMNKIDTEDALDRLVNDLSEDEISMVIGIFGEDCDSRFSKQNDFNLPPETHKIGQTMDSVPMSRHAFRHEISPHEELHTGTTATTDGGKYHTPLPRSFIFRHNNSTTDRRGVSANGVILDGDKLVCGARRCSVLEEVRQTIPFPLIHDANKIALQQHSASVPSLVVLGEPLSASLAKEQQMAHKRSAKDTEIGGVSQVCDGDHSSISLPPFKKRANTPRNVSSETKDVGIASSSYATATGAVRTDGIPPANSNGMKNEIIDDNSTMATPSIDTYIAPPQNPNEDLWNKHFKEAQEFVLKHGHCRIPTTYPPGPDLAKWAKRQRCYYKIYKKHVLDRPQNPAIVSTKALHRGKFRFKPGARLVKCLMTAGRLAKLQSISFCMDLQEGNWEQNYKLLCEYAKRNNGRTYCSKHEDHDLWKWIGTQRYQMRLSKKRAKSKSTGNTRYTPCLTPERIAKLNKIKFCWEDRDAVEERASTGIHN